MASLRPTTKDKQLVVASKGAARGAESPLPSLARSKLRKI